MTTRANQSALEFFLGGLLRRYRERVPDVERVLQCMIRDGVINKAEDIENDHIAFRTMGVPNLGIASLEKIFLHHGYERRDCYRLAEKKLNAFWYSPPMPQYPRIFLSELRVPDLSVGSQSIISSYTGDITRDPVDALDLDEGTQIDEFLHRGLWRIPTWGDYQALAGESEYAAWVIHNRYFLNHFTVSVHNLPAGYNTIAEFNLFLERNNFKLNDSGGKAKTSPDGLLCQSATVAEMTDATFAPELGVSVLSTHMISGSYVEFAERRVLPEFRAIPPAQIGREHRRDGFEVGNADKIFESTYSQQTSKDEG